MFIKQYKLYKYYAHFNVVSRIRACDALVHLSSLISRFSTIYPVIGDPPSFLGFDQVIVIESSVVSTPFGIPGAPGISEIHVHH